MKKYLVLVLSIVFLLIHPMSILAYYNNMPASVVVGQPNFVSSSANQGSSTSAYGLSSPSSVLIAEGKLLVSDTANYRILIWNRVPTQNNTPADVVIGQPNMETGSNYGCTANSINLIDGGMVYIQGKLVLADSGNRRLLVWNQIPTVNNSPADIVIGQPDFTTCADQGTTAYSVSGGNLGSDGTRLFFSDQNKNRVLIFNQLPSQSGYTNADLVLGQPDFTSSSSGTTSSRFSGPREILYFGGRLVVADQGNKRALVWNSIPTENNSPANVVIGQADFTSATAHVVSSRSISKPLFMAVDPDGRLFIGDAGNSRVLIWNSIPTQNYAEADIVLGQPNFTKTTYDGVLNATITSNGASTRNGLDAGSNYLVSGHLSLNRVLIFNNIVSTPTVSINSVESVEDSRLRISGSVHLGEIGKYVLDDVNVSVNSGGNQFVTHLEQVKEDVDYGETIYEYYHIFEPWSNTGYDSSSWNGEKGFSLKITAESQNADDTSLFYFSPFNLLSVSSGITFSVPADQVQTIKNNIDHFEVWNKQRSDSEWTQVNGDISTSELDEHGVATLSLTSSGETKIVAVSKESGWRQDSNTLESEYSGSYINPTKSRLSANWYPLQIDSITGVTKYILSSFAPEGIESIYYSSTYTPVFRGTAFSNSTVAMRVTNKDNLDEYNDYSVQAVNSSWSITPRLYRESIINVSVYDGGRYNQLLPFIIKI